MIKNIFAFVVLCSFVFVGAEAFAEACDEPNIGALTAFQQKRLDSTTLTVAGVYWEFDETDERWTGVRVFDGSEVPSGKAADMPALTIAGINGVTSDQRNEINTHLISVCETLKTKMEQRDRAEGIPQTDQTYEVLSFTTCQKEYLVNELNDIQRVLKEPRQPGDETSCPVDYSRGISSLVTCIKASDDYKACQTKISELSAEIREKLAEDQDKETRQEVTKKQEERKKKQDQLKNMILNPETQISVVQGYISSLEYYVSNARTRKLGTATGSFDVGRLSIGNEKNYSITTDMESDTNLLNRIIQFLLGIIGTFAIVVIVIGGFFLIISNGDENLKVQGKTIITYALGGVVLAFLSYIIVQFVLGILFATGG